jgi:nitrogen fixation/metabolism regulation signal transduction histidine kinase
VTGFLIIVQVFALIRYVEKTNQNLSRFFLAIKHGDFSRSFSGKELGSSFEQLIESFNDVMKKVQQSRSEKEMQYRYLQTIVHHVGIGLITFQADGNVDMINTAAKRLLKVAHLKNINSLSTLSRPLVEKLFSLKTGDRALVKIDAGEMELAIHAAEFRLKEQKYTLVSLQNIQSELQEKEMEAWQTLTRVLTHEIMNSMTPITSMTATILDLLAPHSEKGDEVAENHFDTDIVDDIKDALKTIHKRSQGLIHFVSAYRNLTLIPPPKFKVFPIEELFIRIEKLMENKFKENKILFEWAVEPKTLELTADPGLIEQVLINLILNAIDALHKSQWPKIKLSTNLDETGRVVIDVWDNGPGIFHEAIRKIFTPFFTTKKKGSGIGLSLSRQIMKLHKGTISVHSIPNKNTVFTLKF